MEHPIKRLLLLKIDVKYNIVQEPRFHANQPVGQIFTLNYTK